MNEDQNKLMEYFTVVRAPNLNNFIPTDDGKWVLIDNYKSVFDKPIVCDSLDELTTAIKKYSKPLNFDKPEMDGKKEITIPVEYKNEIPGIYDFMFKLDRYYPFKMKDVTASSIEVGYSKVENEILEWHIKNRKGKIVSISPRITARMDREN